MIQFLMKTNIFFFNYKSSSVINALIDISQTLKLHHDYTILILHRYDHLWNIMCKDKSICHMHVYIDIMINKFTVDSWSYAKSIILSIGICLLHPILICWDSSLALIFQYPIYVNEMVVYIINFGISFCFIWQKQISRKKIIRCIQRYTQIVLVLLVQHI